MSDSKPIIGLVGSPNPEGRTNELVSACLAGAEKAGAEVELIQLAEHRVKACKDCLKWVCKDELKCSFKDEAFEFLTQKLMNCGGLVLGTPVYWWDTSGLVRYLILKMVRVMAFTSPSKGLPAVGISIAGGTGTGLITALRPVYTFFEMLNMRPLEPLPVSRFNWAESMVRAGELGAEMAGLSSLRHPFPSYAARLAGYDELPYLQLDRYGERRLLAAQLTLALAEEKQGPALAGLARADKLEAAGRRSEAMEAVYMVYEFGFEAFGGLES